MNLHTAVYIAGPMSHIPSFNHPLFHKVAALLRDMDIHVINPAEMDSKEMQRLAMASPDGDPTPLCEECNETWGDVLARDVRVISNEVRRIVLLPGWENSRGAQLEAFVGLLCDCDFRLWNSSDQFLEYVKPSHVRDRIMENPL